MCNAPAMPDLIGTGEALKILDVDRSTVTRWVATGRLRPAQKLPGRNGAFVFERDDVEDLAAELRETASA